MSRRAKIVCTIGPVTAIPEKIWALVRAGMDVARLNFSHGTHAEHARVYSMIRQASDESGRAVGILADLQGPKIRLGRFAAGPGQWRTGDVVRVTGDGGAGAHDWDLTDYAGVAEDARGGGLLFVEGGEGGVVVRTIGGNDVVCGVGWGGLVGGHQGLSMPGMNVSVPAMSVKD